MSHQVPSEKYTHQELDGSEMESTRQKQTTILGKSQLRRGTFQSNLTIRDKQSQIQSKSRSPTHDRSLSFVTMSPVKLKSQTIAQAPRESADQHRSRQKSANSIVSKSPSSKRQKINFQYEQVERIQRIRQMKPKKNMNKINIFSVSKINVQSGKSRGWLVIRQYLIQKISKRKLKKIIEQ